MMLDADGASPNQGPKNAINDAVVDRDGTVPRYDLEQFAERAKMRSMANELHELRKQQQLASEKGEKQRENKPIISGTSDPYCVQSTMQVQIVISFPKCSQRVSPSFVTV